MRNYRRNLALSPTTTAQVVESPQSQEDAARKHALQLLQLDFYASATEEQTVEQELDAYCKVRSGDQVLPLVFWEVRIFPVIIRNFY